MRERLIPAKKRVTKDFIEQELKNIKTLCAHIDIWSSKKMDGYLGISVAGIKDDFSCFKAYLACKNIKGRHTGLAILRVYEEVVQLWKLQNKVHTFLYSNLLFIYLHPFFQIKRVVTDNASNMIRAFNIGFPNWENVETPIVDADSNSVDMLYQGDASGQSNSIADCFSLCVLPAECEITLEAMDDEGITN